MGLLMMGVSAYQREDYKMAIAQWDRLLQDLEPGSEDAQQVEGNIAQAKQKMSQKSPGKSPQKP
jgi:cytochrome c-type biogenesis protein CcmH